jgi:hypothetical protein
MKHRALAIVSVYSLSLVTLSAASGGCTSSSGGPGGGTAGFDSGAPAFDSSMPDMDSSMSEPDSSMPAPDSGAASEAGPTDATAEAEAAAPTCATYVAPVELDASNPDGATSINAEGGAPLPGPPPATCSLVGDTPAPFQLTNNSPCAVDVWWVGYDCSELYYGTAAPGGGTFFNDTWETNPWRVRLAGSEELVEELPALPEGAPDAGVLMFTYP